MDFLAQIALSVNNLLVTIQQYCISARITIWDIYLLEHTIQGWEQNNCTTSILSMRVFRNWPRNGLRWSGLCCHSRHSTSGAGRRAAAFDGRPLLCCAGSGSTNHSSADSMSGEFLFYHRNIALHNDKSHDDHDDETPCWTALAGNAIVMMKASIETVFE